MFSVTCLLESFNLIGLRTWKVIFGSSLLRQQNAHKNWTFQWNTHRQWHKRFRCKAFDWVWSITTYRVGPDMILIIMMNIASTGRLDNSLWVAPITTRFIRVHGSVNESGQIPVPVVHKCCWSSMATNYNPFTSHYTRTFTFYFLCYDNVMIKILHLLGSYNTIKVPVDTNMIAYVCLMIFMLRTRLFYSSRIIT